jgi:dTDP-4-dehydrorhamnose reductase
MNILIFGGNGMLGHQLCMTLSQHNVSATVRAFTDKTHKLSRNFGTHFIQTTDITNSNQLESIIDDVNPDVVINCCGVVKQHGNKLTDTEYHSLNSIFPWRLATRCVERSIRLVHISTDCVFDGQIGNYSEKMAKNSTDIYGMSKSLGEVTGFGILTLRTSIIGFEITSSTHGLLEWFVGDSPGPVEGYTRAFFSGLTTESLSKEIDFIITSTKLSGLYNVGGERVSKFDLLNLIGKSLGTKKQIVPSCHFEIDRSLDSKSYWHETGRSMPDWIDMTSKLRRNLDIRVSLGIR